MRAVLILLLVACGGPTKKPDDIGNKTTTDAPMGSAKVIQRSQTGGVIELGGDRGTALEDASKAMSDHCGKDNFMVVQEGEEAIGDSTETAWRVHYVCNGT